MPNITGRRPRRATASATAPGKLPPPQMIASGSPPSAMRGSSGRIVAVLIGLAPGAGPHQGPLAAGANEADDFCDQRIVSEFACERLDALGEPPVDEEQATVGAAQPMHLGSRRATPPQADDVQADQGSGL